MDAGRVHEAIHSRKPSQANPQNPNQEQSWANAISVYKQKETEILGQKKEDVYSKLLFMEKLPSDLDQIYRRLMATNEYQTLSRMLSSTSSEDELIKLVALIDRAGVYNAKAVFYERLLDPAVTKQDKVIFIRYLSARTDKDNTAAFEALIRHACNLMDKNLQYDGKRSLSTSEASSRLDRFMMLLDLIDSDHKILKYLSDLNGSAIGNMMSSLKKDDNVNKLCQQIDNVDIPRILASIKSNPNIPSEIKNNDALLKVVAAKMLFDSVNYGTGERQLLYYIYQDKYYSALKEGNSGVDVAKAFLVCSLANSAKVNISEHLPMILTLGFIADSPEKVDDEIIKDQAIDYTKKIIAAYLATSEKDSERKLSIEMLLNTYLENLRKLDVPRERIASLIAPLKVKPTDFKGQVTDADLRQKDSMPILPANLPQKTIDILKKMGIWDDICRNTIRITLAKNSDGSVISQLSKEGGHAACFGLITIDTFDEATKRYISDEELAVIIAHEAGGHITWMNKNYSNDALLRTVPNERNAFILSYNAAQAVLKDTTVLDNPAAILNIALLAFTSKKALEGANIILGYKVNDFSQKTSLPIDHKERDLDIYPTQVPTTTPDLPVKEEFIRMVTSMNPAFAKYLESVEGKKLFERLFKSDDQSGGLIRNQFLTGVKLPSLV